MRLAPTFYALLLPMVAHAQDFSKPVSYETKAVATGKIFTDLTKKSGIDLRASGDIESEPLILRLEAVPLRDAMDQLADVFAADWVDHHGFWRLERSEAKEAVIKKAALKARLAAFKTSIERDPSSNTKNAFDQATANQMTSAMRLAMEKQNRGEAIDGNQFYSLQRQSPVHRLSLAILANMDLTELALIKPGQRCIYSTAPTPLQKQLPSMPPEALTEFKKQCSLLEDAIQKTGSDRSFLWQMHNALQMPAGDIKRVVVTAEAPQHEDDLNLTFIYELGDNQRDTKDFVTIGLTPELFAEKQKEFVALRQDAQKDGITLDPIVMEIAPATIFRPAGELRPISQNAMDFLLHPTQFDPLSRATSEIILESARRQHCNAICLAMDDAEFFAMNSARIGKTNLATFKTMAETKCQMTISYEKGWIVAKPMDPEDAYLSRMPREALENFIQPSIKQGYVSIEDAAELLATIPETTDFRIARRYVSYSILQHYLSAMGDEPDLLRFFGLLSDQQKQMAKQGELKLNLLELDGAQKSAVTNLFFYGIDFTRAKTKPTPEDMGFYEKERTDFFPQGTASDAQIIVTDHGDTVYYLNRGGDQEVDCTFKELPMWIAQSQHPEVFRGTSPIIVHSIATGVKRKVTIEFVGNRSLISEAQEDHKGEGMSVDQFIASLSNDQRTQIQAEVTRYLDMYRNSDDSASRATSAKPPR